MPFDLSTAKPVTSGGFDLSTAKPVAAPVAHQDSSGILDSIKQGAINLGSGAVRGAGSIGATFLWPIDKAIDMIMGDRDPNVGGLISGKQPLSRNEQRRRDIDAGLTALVGSDPNSLLYKAGKLGGEVAGTAGVGGVLANGVRAAAPALESVGMAWPTLTRLASSVESGGMTLGGTGSSRIADLGIRAAGGAATGGASATLVNPDDVSTGAVIGAALPVAGRALRYAGGSAKSLVDPLTEAGRSTIAGHTLVRFANDPDALASAVGGRTITGARPTLAEATGDAGIARLQDALRAADPQFENRIGGRLAENNAARVNTLQGIAMTPADREAAVAAVDARSKNLYDLAFQESIPVTSELERLSRKPSVQKAEARAIQLAREQGIPFQARLDDMRPKTVYAGMRDLPESGFTIPDNPAPVYAGRRSLPDSSVIDVSSKFSPLTMNPQPVESVRSIPSGSVDNYVDLPPGIKDISVPSGRVGTFVDIPPVESVPVRDMHTLKMGMDALLQDPTLGIAGREAAAVKATRNKLLDQLPESYQEARRGHIEMSKPVNQIDIGNYLLDSYSSATKDLTSNPKLRAEAFNRALQNEERLIKRATGVKGIKNLSDVMTPEQLAGIRGVADELSRTAAVAEAGNGAGAASAQRLASKNILQQLMSPLGFSKSAAEGAFVNTLAKPLNWVYRDIVDPKIQQSVIDAVLDPATAAALVRRAQQSGASLPDNALTRLMWTGARTIPTSGARDQ